MVCCARLIGDRRRDNIQVDHVIAVQVMLVPPVRSVCEYIFILFFRDRIIVIFMMEFLKTWSRP